MSIQHAFGVEIETLFDRELAARTVAYHFETPNTVRHLCDIYDSWVCCDRAGRTWKFSRDSSLVPSRDRPADPCEIITPLLNWNDMETLKEVCEVLEQAGAYANDTCGVHVHVESSGLNHISLRNLAFIESAFEELLIESLKVEDERLSVYCQRTKQDFINVLKRTKPQTIDAFKGYWYASNPDPHRSIEHHYHKSRYRILNFHSYFQGKGVEFRLFNGTLNFDRIRAYIHISCAMVGRAQETKSCSSERVSTDNPAYTFRCWLLRLGLIGDEYKTTRKILLSNLRGNAAWKNAPETQRRSA